MPSAILYATEIAQLQRFIARDPLYETRQFVRERDSRSPDKQLANVLPIHTLLDPTFAIDVYCPGCGNHSIFNAAPVEDIDVQRFVSLFRNGGVFYRHVGFACSRERTHVLVAGFRLWSADYRHLVPTTQPITVTKIGMFPSLADVQEPLDRRSTKAIGARNASEFKRAVGLSAHGVGIGAFVYLRRIFETLIDEVYAAATSAGEVDRDTYERSRMDEKITLLKGRLPAFLVENKQWYGIVSKGIHELSETECLEYFDVVKSGIEIIVEQKAEAIEQAERQKTARESIQRISAKLITPKDDR